MLLLGSQKGRDFRTVAASGYTMRAEKLNAGKRVEPKYRLNLLKEIDNGW